MSRHKRKVYDKLVRDKTSAHLQTLGLKHEQENYEDDYAFSEALGRKLIEEATEASRCMGAAAQGYLVEELADLMEVYRAILKHHKISQKKVEDYRKKKVMEKGAFNDRCHLHWVERAPDDPR